MSKKFNSTGVCIPKKHYIINIGVLYGIFKEENGLVKISNRIFEQRIYNYFISKLENNINNMTTYNFRENFINEDVV